MGSVKRFFRKFLLSTVGILALFFAVNLLLLTGVLAFANGNSAGSDISIGWIADRIALDLRGEIVSDEAVSELLKEKNAWAMILGQDGRVIWSARKPEEVPSQYTLTDVARFSRWYLQDYPVYVLAHPAGLLVVGCARGSLQKYSFSLDTAYVSAMLTGAGVVVAANALLMVFLMLRNARRVERAVVPILAGIETVSRGEPVSLPEKGELAEINAKLNRAGKHIAQKDAARAEWIGGISHDVGTPLSIMLGYAAEIEEDPSLPPAVRAQAGMIKRQGERLRSLTADLTLTSRLEYAMQPLRAETVDPLELAREAISEILNRGVEEKYAFRLLSPPGARPFTLRADRALLVRLLENLIGNAVKHNPDGCSVTVEVAREGASCVITVADDGAGVEAERLEAFNRGVFSKQPSRRPGEPTHGFGLKLSAQIARAHGGAIRFVSAQPHGLRITVSLPMQCATGAG